MSKFEDAQMPQNLTSCININKDNKTYVVSCRKL